MSHEWYQHYPPGVQREIDISGDKNIAAKLEKACERYGDKVAISCMGADLTYRQLDRLASQFATYLQKHAGLKAGDRLAIMLPNTIQFAIAFFGAQKVGVVCVNTNPLYTPREMRHQFKDSGATAIVIMDMFLDKLEKVIEDTDIQTVIATSIGDQLPVWKGCLIDTIMKVKGDVPRHQLDTVSFKNALSKGRRRDYEPADTHHEDLAMLQYTGGTTGLSKGAMLMHKNILANMAQIENAATGQIVPGKEVVLTALPLYHIFALSVNFLTFLGMGQHMILVPKPIPIKNVLSAFKKYPITIMTGVNTLYNALVNNKQFNEHPPKHLKLALAGGMAVQEAVNKKWQNVTGLRIVEGFGLTESAPVTHVNPIGENTRVGSIGIPVASTDAKIMDPNTEEEQPNGEPGELVVNGPQVMAGYWNRPEDTSKTLRDGWLWTGDIAKRADDGFFYIVDRKKDLIIVSGFNVYPNEVEDVLVEHPKVLEAAVVGISDSKSGESVKAFVVPKDKSLTVEELKSHCNENLTGYKKPRHFEFREELPKTNVGKILRRQLRDEQNESAQQKESSQSTA